MRIHVCQYTRQSTIIEQPIVDKLTAFHNKLANCEFKECSNCNESFPVVNPNSIYECTHCKKDKCQSKLYSHANNMDPGVVPCQLQGPTHVEELDCSCCTYDVSVSTTSWPIWLYWSCIQINLPQDVSPFASRLPRTPSELGVVLGRKVS